MARRIASSSARWSYISETLLPQDQPRINALKSISDKYARQIVDKPAELPKIDWNFYKTRITLPGMVDSYQKNYESLKIPYPSDQGALSEVESSNANMVAFADKKLQELIKKIDDYKAKLSKLESVMKYSEMTMEEFLLARPDQRFDPNNPELWPQQMKDPAKEKESH